MTIEGFLIVYSADRSEIYGEFADGAWIVEETDAGSNHVLSGVARGVVLDTFRNVNEAGVSHVAFTFEVEGVPYTGQAQLLAPQDMTTAEEALVRIETGEAPKMAISSASVF
jgi:hypothetical protein